MINISEKDKLELIKLKIKIKTEKEIRWAARFIMLTIMLILIYFGIGFSFAKTLFEIGLLILVIFISVPILFGIIISFLIKYITELRYEKYLKGENIGVGE